MAKQLHEVEFETRTIGPLVLTTPMLRRLGFREIVNRHCPIAEQAELDHGLVAELVTQSRLSDPTALYDLPGWAERFAITTLGFDHGAGHSLLLLYGTKISHGENINDFNILCYDLSTASTG